MNGRVRHITYCVAVRARVPWLYRTTTPQASRPSPDLAEHELLLEFILLLLYIIFNQLIITINNIARDLTRLISKVLARA